tara:strand:+ start:71 stop:505 length:435 start_codon:yes stop_codon:yes gene_type:complete
LTPLLICLLWVFIGGKNNMQEKKLIKRLEEINNLLSKNVDLKLINEKSEIEFSLNKKNINFTLRGDNKYYYANQCAEFTKNLEKFGFGSYINKDMIKRNGICFNEYSINNGYNQYCRDMKRFNNKQEMLGFVIGYNESINNMKT